MEGGTKTIMIFGAGINQLELIREAKAMGILTVVIDPQKDPPGKAESDFFYQVEGKDYETTKAIAIKHNVNGIVTGQMERPMRLMARLAHDLGFIFHSPEVVERSLDKWLMKNAFIACSVPCAKGILLKSDEELDKNIVATLNFPLIIKPRDAFSSRGVYKVDLFDDLTKYLPESKSYSSNGDVLIEEFLEGKEYSVETISYCGVTTIIQYTEKIITPYPNTVEMGHIQPADLTEKEKEDIKNIVISGINALGINNSAAHSEVMLTHSGAKVIEIGARLGGDFIGSHLTKSSTGISMDRAAIQIALGIMPDICFRKHACSCIKYLKLPKGRVVKEIMPQENLNKMPNIIFTYIFIKQGDIIQPVIHSGLRPGCIIVEGMNKKNMLRSSEKYLSILQRLIITE